MKQILDECTHSAWIHIGTERYCGNCGINRDEIND